MHGRAALSKAGVPLGVRFLEHTADIGFEVEASSAEECFARAAAAMFASFVPPEPPPGAQTISVPVRVQAEGAAELMVAWLEELLYLSEVRGYLLTSFEVEEADGRQLRGRAEGWQARTSEESLGPAIKGITRHGLLVEATKDGWRARVYLDV